MGGGTYAPSNALSVFNGQESAGSWTLTLQDGFNQDGGSLNSWALEICTATVEPPNQPPLITSPGTQSSTVGDVISLPIVASDPDGDTLVFTASSLPAGLQINSASGTISGTLATGSDGPYAVTVAANDGQGNSVEVSFGWQVDVDVPGTSVTVEVRVAASADDAEEKPSGSISLSSSDLELTTDGSNNQWIGMRFAGISIPVGATISNAWVQFQTDETGSSTTQLRIYAQAADNAAGFATNSGNVSSRTRTGNQVNWSVAPWPVRNVAGADQRTPDLSSIVQEVVSRSGWQSGQALVVLIDGSGKRTAESYNGDASAAPLLHIEYTTDGEPPNQPPLITSPGAQSSTVGDVASLPIAANDPEGDTLAFTASGLPAGLQINSASGTISGTLATGSDGPHAVTITVSDGQGNSPEVSFSWQVNVPGAATTVEIRVAASADDAEEKPLVPSLCRAVI